MAGEQLLDMMEARGGSDSDYSDIVFGTVVSEKPLKIQISNQMVLTDAFLNLSKAVTDHKVKVKDGNDTKTVTVLGALKKGDGVTMIRQDGGQQFYVLEKIGGDEDG
ncbi:DUF2577 domain-containing protein [Levilactobacillus namurensis]|uniref:DUF2577 domain-containing protein n=1 Tax=Levilactobacillus namurensis TaxID=380393 RepID=A0AAW8W8T2_9LACO|nr:DUF2577 domain-containing protein [Levilactobacillus namurensis]MDT7015136.1 DUF2577 domain-containing protein [Levilactobacillus namurensis]MDT7015315.1 DUF2577 domain-containing protein [Levilactobacillus namurensis]MDT7015557.1 DUF2577 domain-containing protein [Levilactobacillus namurensis]